MHTPETCQLMNCQPNQPHHTVIPAGVNWFSESWGGIVHMDSHGSWIRGAHGEELDS